MNYLIGDIGNTSTRICILNEKFTIRKSKIFETKIIFKNNYLKKILKNFLSKNLKSTVLMSSVVPLAFKKFKKILKHSKFKTIEIKDLNIKKIIKINVKNIDQLGSDRIVNAIGAKKFKNSIVIDFGTATTFDIVKDSVYEGGVIAPGIKLSMMNLTKSTALLPKFVLKNKQTSYGKNSKDALNAGFLWGYEGLIKNILKKITHSSKKKYKVILTGGYASLFNKLIKSKSMIDQDITIKGIAKVYKYLI